MFIILTMLAFFSIEEKAYAYFDPNAGGFLFQILTPFVSLALTGIFFCRDRLKAAYHSIKKNIKRKETDFEINK